MLKESETSNICYLKTLCSAVQKQSLAGERVVELSKGSNLHNKM